MRGSSLFARFDNGRLDPRAGPDIPLPRQAFRAPFAAGRRDPRAPLGSPQRPDDVLTYQWRPSVGGTEPERRESGTPIGETR